MTSDERAALIAEARAYSAKYPHTVGGVMDLLDRLAEALEASPAPSPVGWEDGLNAEPPPVTSDRSLPPQLLALSKKATPGPWTVTSCMDYWVGTADTGIALCGDIDWLAEDSNGVRDQDTMRANAELIAGAVNYVRSCESTEAAEETGDGATPNKPLHPPPG